MAGRPTKLTDELRELIAADVRLGVQPDVAAQAHGIVRSTYFKWMADGADAPDGTPLRAFSDALKQALAQGEAYFVKRIANAEKGWPSSAWILERRWPMRYAVDRLLKNENVKAARAVPKLAELEKQVNELQARLNGEGQSAQADRGAASEAPSDPPREDDASPIDGED